MVLKIEIQSTFCNHLNLAIQFLHLATLNFSVLWVLSVIPYPVGTEVISGGTALLKKLFFSVQIVGSNPTVQCPLPPSPSCKQGLIKCTRNLWFTWLYSAIAKPNMTIKTKQLSIFWNYLAQICKAEIPCLPPFNLNPKFLFIIFLDTL